MTNRLLAAPALTTHRLLVHLQLLVALLVVTGLVIASGAASVLGEAVADQSLLGNGQWYD